MESITKIDSNSAGYKYECFLNRQDSLHSWIFDTGLSTVIGAEDKVGMGALYDLSKRISWDGQPHFRAGDTITYTKHYPQSWTEYGFWTEHIKNNDYEDRNIVNTGKVTNITELGEKLNNLIFGEKKMKLNKFLIIIFPLVNIYNWVLYMFYH